MLCLGIETSCDETAVAVFDGTRILAEKVLTQIPTHAVFGGVVPEIASREHLRCLDEVVQDTLVAAKVQVTALEAIAVTRGPGLLGALLVGVSYAKGLACALDIPIVGVNHLHAHLMACAFAGEICYPALGLLVSGGHTHLYQMESPDECLLLGKTLDDAAGEALDKVAKMLNLPYPGGKYIDSLGVRGHAEKFSLPRPYLDNDNFDFSFSGLKTAAHRTAGQHGLTKMVNFASFSADCVPEILCDFCAAVNQAVVSTLLEKARRTLRVFSPRMFCLAGGVAANSVLRYAARDFATKYNLKFLAPPLQYCGDNGAMVAYTGHHIALLGKRSLLDFEAIPRGKHVPADYIQNTVSRSE